MNPPARSAPRLATLAILVAYALPLPGWIWPAADIIGHEPIFWAMTALLLAYIRLVERRPFASIGATVPTLRSLAWGLAAAALMIAGFAAIYLVLFPLLGDTGSAAHVDAVRALPFSFRVALVVRAAVFEELYYRGFAIERLTELTGRRYIAALLSLAAFTLAHLGYWGWDHLLVAGFGGAVLTALYLWRRDIAANMLAHFVTDGVGLLLG